jgi:hypothetical protein
MGMIPPKQAFSCDQTMRKNSYTCIQSPAPACMFWGQGFLLEVWLSEQTICVHPSPLSSPTIRLNSLLPHPILPQHSLFSHSSIHPSIDSSIYLLSTK